MRIWGVVRDDRGEVITIGILGWLAITSLLSTTIIGGSQVVASVKNKGDLDAAAGVMRDEAGVIKEKMAGRDDADSKIMVENAGKMEALADKTETGANLDVAKNVSQTVYDAGSAAVPFTKLTKVGKAVKFSWDVYGGTGLGQAAIDAATAPPADIAELQKDIEAIDFGKVGTKPPEASGDPVEDYILDAKIRAMANVVNSTLANKKSSGANADEYAALTRDLAMSMVLDMTIKDGPGTTEDEVTLPSFGENPFKTALADEVKLIDPANPATGPMGGIILAADDKKAFEAGDLEFAIGQYYGAKGLEPIIVTKDDKGALKSQLPLVKNSPLMATGNDYKPEQKALPAGWDGSVKSCPFLYAWDGAAFSEVNDIISVSRDPKREYVDSMLFAAKASADGRLELRVSEVRDEESFIDQIALRAVDVPDGYTAALSPDGRAYSVRDAAPALSVSGVPASALTSVDGAGLQGYDGVSATAEFAAPGRDAVLLLTVDGFQHDATKPVISPKRPGVRVEAFADGTWTLVGEARPRELADTTAFDVARFARAGRVKVRITAVSCDTSVFQLVDSIALSSAPSGLARVRTLAPRVSGPGSDAAARLRDRDDSRVHLVPGQTITLTVPDPGADAYIIDSIGWYREL
ncbi:MAG: hypothetical protein Q7W16_02340 [Coriobacteriia bacterium]|nr:hypothetical protein [Coriobacteriia bacterium]